MKKLLRNIILMLVLAAAFLYLYDRFVFYKVNEAAYQYHNELTRIPSAKIISIGTSEGKRIKWGAARPDDLSDLCIAGSDLSAAADVLNSTVAHISPSQIVLLDVNNTSLYTMEASTVKSENAVNINTQLFFYNLPVSYLTGSNFIKYIKSRLYLINNVGNTEGAFANVLKIILPSGIYKKIKAKEEDPEKDMDKPLKGKAYDHFAESQKNAILHDTKSFPDVHRRNVEILKKMQETALGYHLTLVVYSCPRNAKYVDVFGKAMADSTADNLVVTMKALHITYFDHLYDPDFIHEESYFHDSAHLNKKGARKFDDKLFSEIASRYPQFQSSFTLSSKY